MAYKRTYLTTAIAYVNAKAHLGHALEFILGDCILRHNRDIGLEVLGQTGTDEYGQKLERTAQNKKMDPKEYCDLISKTFRDLKETFNLSYDQFIRTTDPEHHLSVRKIWLAAKESGDIYKKKYKGLYCTGCESFIQEKDLVSGKCPNHNKEPEIVEEENYFFRLSKYGDEILKWLKDNPEIVFPESRYKEIVNIVSSGLEDISISRPRTSLNWGVEVPDDTDHVVYVWFDALTNYLTGVGYYEQGDKYMKWWESKDSEVINLIGKDIIRHHIAIWPAMLLSAKVPLPNKYIVHGFVLADGQKMSKSMGNVVDPVVYANKYGSDALRWYLLKEIPNGQDGNFAHDRFVFTYNSDLANNIGNLYNRVLTLVMKYDIQMPEKLPTVASIEKAKEEYNESFRSLRVDKAASKIIDVCDEANLFIGERQPWVVAKEDKEALIEIMVTLFTYLVEINKMLKPFVPQISEKLEVVLSSRPIVKPDVLFPKIEEELD